MCINIGLTLSLLRLSFFEDINRSAIRSVWTLSNQHSVCQDYLFFIYKSKCYQICMDTLEEGLLGGRGRKQKQEYKRRFEQCQLRVMTLRNKNNELQRQCRNQLESDMRKAIRQQTAFVEAEIKDLRDMIAGLSKDFPDPQSKTKIKQLWIQTGREIERNTRIMQQFMSRSSVLASVMYRSGIANYKSRIGQDRESTLMQPIPQQNRENGSSMMESDDLLDQVRLQQQILAERGQLLRELQQKNLIINRIMNEMGEIVGGEQRQLVQQLEDNMQEAHNNLVQANEELGSAIVYQKSSKKRYFCLVVVIVVVLLMLAGLIYFFI